jgi:hypothetical protein
MLEDGVETFFHSFGPVVLFCLDLHIIKEKNMYSAQDDSHSHDLGKTI